MVLAAGRGERMRPLSDVLPKPALPLPDGPVVSSSLRLAAAAGARSVTVNLWHLADRMERALRRLELPGVTIATSREETLMGTAGGLALARDRGRLGRDGPVLVINGDCLLSLELAPLLARCATTDDLVTLALLPHPDPGRWSRVVVGETGSVTAMLPPGAPAPDEAPFLYPGVMVVSREALDALPVAALATPVALWEPARAAGRLGGVEVRGGWREVGTPAGYLEAALDRLGGGSAVEPAASVDSRATLRSSFVGGGGAGRGGRCARGVGGRLRRDGRPGRPRHPVGAPRTGRGRPGRGRRRRVSDRTPDCWRSGSGIWGIAPPPACHGGVSRRRVTA